MASASDVLGQPARTSKVAYRNFAKATDRLADLLMLETTVDLSHYAVSFPLTRVIISSLIHPLNLY